jgi:adenine-specific DNA-methyltransferase
LDFFAGSGTTGDAVMQLNVEDGGNRKFILVQLPEPIDPNKTAYEFVKNDLKAEPTIFEITKERLKRITEKIIKENINQPARTERIMCEGIHDEHCDTCKREYSIKIEAKKEKDLSKIDLGFKVYETIPVWEDYDFEAEELHTQISLFDENKLSADDIKSLLVTWKTYDGIPLTQDLETINLGKYTSHYCNGKLYLMDKGFTTDHMKVLLEKIDSEKKSIQLLLSLSAITLKVRICVNFLKT